MESWIFEILENHGYFGVLFLIAIENIFPPIPSEVILLFGGFITTKTDLTATGVVIYSTIGSVFGAMILYGVGMTLDKNRMEKLVDRWGHVVRLKREDINKADSWFAKYGVWTVFFCRFIPLIRSLISIPAGMAHMNLGVFLLLTTIGTLIWNVILVNLGATVGNSWETIVQYVDIYSNIAYIVLVVIAFIFIVLFIKNRLIRK